MVRGGTHLCVLSISGVSQILLRRLTFVQTWQTSLLLTLGLHRIEV